MAQQQWTVPGYGGIPYKVGLYHGTKTGHLLVQCNGKVLILDYGVTKHKSYSFMLGEELYELDIIKHEGQYTYKFKHNEDTQTPHNIRREKTKKTDKRRLWIAGFFFIALTFVVFAVFNYWSDMETKVRHRLAAGEGEYVQARILKDAQNWLIIYPMNGELIKIQLLKEDSISILGYPLATGDRYQVRTLSAHKYIYYIDWTQPDINTVNRLFSLTADRHQSLHPNLASRQVRCQLQHAYDLEGIEGMAKFYQQDQADWPIYNTNAYLRLIRGIAYRNLVLDCL